MNARRKAWTRAKLRELCRERAPLVVRQLGFVETRAENVRRRLIEREIEYYQIREMAPGLARLEAVARAKKRLARRIERFIRKVEDAA